MIAAVEQSYRFMLAVNLNQQHGKLTQHAHPGRLIVDEGARSSIDGDGSTQDQIFVARVAQALFI